MTWRRCYDWLLGTPWIYDRLRPLLLGGFDFGSVYGWLDAGPDDVIVDVGCGTGHALEYLTSFREYHGFDLDTRALEALQDRHRGSSLTLHNCPLEPAHVERIQPTKGLLMGLLHHLDDAEVASILSTLACGQRLRIVATLDPVYVRGRWISNLLGFADRGRRVRTGEGYHSLASRSSYSVERTTLLSSRNGLATYFAMELHPPGVEPVRARQ